MVKKPWLEWGWRIGGVFAGVLIGALTCGGWVQAVDNHLHDVVIHKTPEQHREFVMKVFEDQIEPVLNLQHEAVMQALEDLKKDLDAQHNSNGNISR